MYTKEWINRMLNDDDLEKYLWYRGFTPSDIPDVPEANMDLPVMRCIHAWYLEH